MSVDLTILPTRGDLCSNDSNINFAHNLLWLDVDYDLWDAINLLANKTSTAVPENFTSYIGTDEEGETCYGKMQTTDAYDNPLRAVNANALGNLKRFSKSTEVNNAVGCYLRALPADWVCVLYWH